MPRFDRPPFDRAELDKLTSAGNDEARARATAQRDTGHGASGQLLSGARPSDEFVFYQSPGEIGRAHG